MRVKVGNVWYDPSDIFIMVELTDQDKYLISKMGDKTKYASFPDSLPSAEASALMEAENGLQTT